MTAQNDDSDDGNVEVLPDSFIPGDFDGNIRLANRIIYARFQHLYKQTKKRGAAKKSYDNLFDPGDMPKDLIEGMLQMWVDCYANGDKVGALAIYDRLRKHLYPELRPREFEPPKDTETIDPLDKLRAELDLIQGHGGDLPPPDT